MGELLKLVLKSNEVLKATIRRDTKQWQKHHHIISKSLICS